MSTTEPGPIPDELGLPPPPPAPSLPSAPPFAPSDGAAAEGRGGLKLAVIGGLVGLALYAVAIVLGLLALRDDFTLGMIALVWGTSLLTVTATSVAVVLVILQRTRPFAVGLLIAIAVGLLIAIGIGAYIVSGMHGHDVGPGSTA